MAEDGNWDDQRIRLADELGSQLVQVSRLLAHHVPQWVRDSGMEGAGFRLLAQLVVNGPQRVGDLASAFSLDRTTVTRQLADLHTAGLVEQYPDKLDKRAQISSPTPRGVEQFRAVRQRRSRSLAALLRDWPTSDLETLVDLLRRLTLPQALPFEPFTPASATDEPGT